MSTARYEFYPVHKSSVLYSSTSSLNTLDLYLPSPSSSHPDKHNYIHGGAWRDPLISSRTVQPALSYLSPKELPIAGVVSLNYRLSPYPNHPTHPSLPGDVARNARHPAHIEDVLNAISWLQKGYDIGEEYVLVGHSCGATLAFQVVMDQWRSTMGTTSGTDYLQMPHAIVGVEGIYDQCQLKESYKHSEYAAVYQEFLEGAFGNDEREWSRASPCNADLAHSWKNGKLAVLAWSKDDELVDELQLVMMQKALLQGKNETRRDVMIQLTGKHDDIWENGTQLANAIRFALHELEGLPSSNIISPSDEFESMSGYAR
ncbi:hypothetical protein MMC32_006610 [Xylographa parallela]|nr:hypothetical protein [Xylographa parallela]